MAFLLLVSFNISAQNKSLGVGIATPNANAALHVESPTNNQGFIMPRLTTSQRNAMAGLLTGTDNGLMLYDTDLKTVFIWDGAAWKNTTQVAGGARLAYPYKDSVTTDYPVNTALLHLIDNNPSGSNRILQMDNLNSNAGTTLRVGTNSGWAPAGFFTSLNDTTTGSTLMSYNSSNRVTAPGGLNPVAIYGHASGTGANAAAFRIDNAGNSYPTIYSESNGTGPTFVGRQLGTGDGVVGHSESGLGLVGITATGWTAALGDHSGTGTGVFGRSVGGVGISAETTNGWTAIDARNNGNGSAFYARSFGGHAGHFDITDSANAASALQVNTVGTGAAANFSYNNASGSTSGVNINSNSNGSALFSESTGNGAGITAQSGGWTAIQSRQTGTTGHAGFLEITNAGNSNIALSTTTAGNGTAVYGRSAGGHAAHFEITEGNNPLPALQVNQNGTGAAGNFTTTGTGDAGRFEVNNTSSTAQALVVESNSLGGTARFQNTNPNFSGSAIVSTVNTNVGGNAFDGISRGTKGHGGSFFVENSANPDPAVTIFTQGQGAALFIGQISPDFGIAIDIGSGTVKYSTGGIGTPGGIVMRAGVVTITAVGTYTIQYDIPQEGEATYMLNNSGGSVFVDGVELADQELKQFIYVAGSWRAVN